MNNDLEKFLINISEEDINKTFNDEEWENNVANAAFYGAVCLTSSKKSSEEIINEIINYNVLKKLRDLFIAKSNPLPKKYCWDNEINIETAFAILENYVAQVSLLNEAERLDKTITLKIITSNKNINKKLKEWCEYFQKVNLNTLKITLIHSTKNTHIITFDKK